jgi:predicted deacetylase
LRPELHEHGPGLIRLIRILLLSVLIVPARAEITVGLRYDDFSASSPTDLEKRILEALARRNLPVTFGVIPEVGIGGVTLPLPAGKRDMLTSGMRAGLLEIALHGHSHRALYADDPSEFAGLSLILQENILIKAKRELERAIGARVHVFIPPWNSYDANTLSAMDGAGLGVLSAEALGTVSAGASLRFVPATCLLPDLQSSVERARVLMENRSGEAVLIVAYFHSFEFKEEDSARGKFSFPDYERVLDWLAAQKDIEVKTLGAMAGSSEADAHGYSFFSRWRRLSPMFIEKAMRPAFRIYPRPGFPVAGGEYLLWGAVFLPFGCLAIFGWSACALCLRIPRVGRLHRHAIRAAGKTLALIALAFLARGIIASSFDTAAVSCLLAGTGIRLALAPMTR